MSYRHLRAVRRTFAAALLCLALGTAASPALADAEATLLDPASHAPAGVLFDHMHKAGEFMVGYRFMYSRQAGDVLHGTSSVSDVALAAAGYSMKPTSMNMYMSMLDIMYAPTDWLSLMVMPQYVSMDMSMQALPTLPGSDAGEHGGHGGAGSHSHSTDGFGDTLLSALVRLYDDPVNHAHVGITFSAPTGSVTQKGADGRYTHYMMQLGSGTWDFVPSLTYTGRADRFAWGAQLLGVIRLEGENEAGFRYGDVFQATGWGSYRLLDWLSGSLRMLYTSQGDIEGHYNGAHNHSSPPDLQANYGGNFLDIGFGLNSVVESGWLRGNRFSIEWLQPVYTDVNGYQLDRVGTLYANWSLAF
ncbi:MAG TPA: transporter [Burkholderiales bacterium]|nr:transporter [Burkholderiales bacterium]